MLSYRRQLLLLALTVLFCISAPAMSDQNDERLADLFEQLQSESEQKVGDSITDEIWNIWRESTDQDVNALMHSGIIAMSEGQLVRAVGIFDEVVRIAPDFAEGWNKRATVYFFLQEFEKSASDVRKTLELEPRHFGATAGLGLIFMQLNYFESAIKAFESALDINPHLVGPKIQIERLKELIELEQSLANEEPSV